MTDTASPNRQRRTADERRKDVLDAAIIEFATLGLHGASTETIAARAGISQPYVLRLFGTKKALFLAAVAQVTDRIMDGWRTSLVGMEDAAPLDKIIVLGAQYTNLTRDEHALRLVLQSFSSAEDPDVRLAAQHCLRSMVAWVQDATGAPLPTIQQFFAYGMMLTVAASIRATDAAPDELWARLYTEVPLR